MILSPGSKGWISKYKNLLQKGVINVSIEQPEGVKKDHFQHLILNRSGIVFGYASELLFCNSLAHPNWTNEERLKLLLFESHLFIFASNGEIQSKISTNLQIPYSIFTAITAPNLCRECLLFSSKKATSTSSKTSWQSVQMSV